MSNIVDAQAYQSNRRRMCWMALGLMGISTIAVIVDPARMEPAESIMMMMYGSLSALVSSYFLLGSKKTPQE